MSYEDLVDNPLMTLERIRERLVALTGKDFGSRETVPKMKPREVIDRENSWVKKFSEKLALVEYTRSVN